MAFLRSTAARHLRTLALAPSLTRAAAQQQRSQLCSLSTRGQTLSLLARSALPKTLAVVRFQSTSDRKNVNEIDEKTESKLQEQKIEPHPELVSADSSTRGVTTEVGQGTAAQVAARSKRDDDDTDPLAGIKGDLQTIRDTFSLDAVPRQAYYVGMAGVLPYLATSLSTVYCAWEINHAHESGSGFLMSEKTAELALHVIEPLQIGYGAVIISFLGAIHWGLEWAGYGGTQGYRRYAIGIFATAFAWPTILLPAEYALIAQFLVFNFLYYSDARACKRGWAPPWYSVYRFVLTFIVGGSIVVSLIGRGQIADKIGKLPSPADRIRALRDSQMASLEDEEVQRRKFLATKDEDEEEEEEGEEEE